MKKRYSIMYYKLFKKTNKMSFLLLFHAHYWHNHENEFMKKYWHGGKRKIYGKSIQQFKKMRDIT